MKQSIDMGQMHREFDTRHTKRHKCLRCDWIMIICISFITSAISAVIPALLLKFVILAPKGSETIPITSVGTTMTTTQRPDKLLSNAFIWLHLSPNLVHFCYEDLF
jgi:hypothetical protein